MMPTVFVVDDDPGVRKSLARMLREEGYDVQAYDSAESFLARPDPHSRGCLLLDVSLSGIDGLALQARLAEAGEDNPIVFLTGRGDIPMTVRAMKRGASDFLAKPVSLVVLLAAVREALERGREDRQRSARAAALARRLDTLTAREREVLSAVVDGKLNKEIAYDLGIVEQTVKYHRARIMERMQASTGAELIRIATELGIGTAGPTRSALPSAAPGGALD
jgi:FixJ family two-component response regulator